LLALPPIDARTSPRRRYPLAQTAVGGVYITHGHELRF